MDLSLVSVDSITVRAHHDAARMHLNQDYVTAWRRPRPKRRSSGQGGGSEDQWAGRRKRSRAGRTTAHAASAKNPVKAARLGSSRGGQTRKVHLAADRKCRPLAFVLTADQTADSPQFIPVLDKVRVCGPSGRPRTRPDAVAGDKAHSSRGNRTHLRKPPSACVDDLDQRPRPGCFLITADMRRSRGGRKAES